MGKRISASVLIAVLAILLAGCVNASISLKINGDGSADYGIELLLPDEALGQLNGQDVWADTQERLKGKGFTVNAVDKQGFSGIRADRHFADVNGITRDNGLPGAEGDATQYAVTARKGLFSTDLAIRGRLDFSKAMPEGDGLDVLSAAMLGQARVTMEVRLPVRAKTHNATSVSKDGLTYTWELMLDGPNEITLDATAPNTLNIALMGGAALLVAAAVVIALAARSARRRRGARSARGS